VCAPGTVKPGSRSIDRRAAITVQDGPGVGSASGPALRLPPADHAPLDQLTRARVPQALGRAAAQPEQPVGADVVFAQDLNDAPERRVGVGGEVCKAFGAGDRGRLR
jgi:hypothetical protein